MGRSPRFARDDGSPHFVRDDKGCAGQIAILRQAKDRPLRLPLRPFGYAHGGLRSGQALTSCRPLSLERGERTGREGRMAIRPYIYS